MDYTVHGILQARILELLFPSSPRDLPNTGFKRRSPALWVDSLPAKPQGKPKNTGVGSLFLLQRIFPTQGLNPGIPHCRRYLPSESPEKPKNTGVGNLFLLQGIFPTQESNQGVLHCRRILYQLSRFSGVQPFEIPCTVACQAPLFMRFSTQEYWSGLDMPASRVSFQPRN